jgi:hypothetical protein
MEDLASRNSSQMILLEWHTSDSYSTAETLEQADAYNLNFLGGYTTPTVVFNGSFMPLGLGLKSYDEYKARFDDLKGQKSSIFITTSVKTAGGKSAVTITLKNQTGQDIQGASLYGVVYENRGLAEYHYVVRDVMKNTSDEWVMVDLAAGASATFQLQADKLYTASSYGMVVILKSSTGQILQVQKAK